MTDRVGLLYWQRKSEFLTCVADTVAALGYQVVGVAAEERLPGELDVLLICGPFGSLVPVVNQLLDRPINQRPRLALWMTEQFSNPRIPEWFHRWLAGALSSLERRLLYTRRGETWQLDSRFARIAHRALRLRNYGNLHWLKQEGMLDVLAVGSRWIANYLHRRGFPAMVAYIGHTPAWGSDLGLERNIPVLWLGKIATRRRRETLDQLALALQNEGIEFLRIDGENHPYIFGEDRTRLLNRTKIMVNVLRTPWDNHSLRFFLAAANRCLIVTEPTFPHIPFVPGKHVVEVELDRIAQTIKSYLSEDAARQAITQEAYQLVTGEITMERSVARILDRVTAHQSPYLTRARSN